MASSSDMKSIMWSSYNAYIIAGHFKPHKAPGKRLRTFYDFVDEICMSLVADFQSNAVHRRHSTQQTVEPRLQSVGTHFPERPADATGNQTCAVCREKFNNYEAANPGPVKNNPFKKSKTVFRCSARVIFLGIREGSNCWMDYYHTKLEYWMRQICKCSYRFP